MKRWLWVIAGGFLGLAACSFPELTVYGVTPTYPVAWDLLGLPRVTNLRPLFTWEPETEPDARYDFIIYEAHEIASSFTEWAIGREVYYREGLKEPHHELEVPLQPNRTYYWSVRVRHGENISEWSRFDYKICETDASGRCDTEEYPFFMFKTPSN